MNLVNYRKRYSYPFLKGMGSVIDLFGVSYSGINKDNFSLGWQKDLQSIGNDFRTVGMDIEKATKNYNSFENFSNK